MHQLMNMNGGKNKKAIKTLVIIATVALTATFLSGCTTNNNGELPKLIQTGSSTVLPLAIAWAEEFDKADISVTGGGSSHGLNALLEGETDLGDASRLLKSKDYEKVGCDGSNVNEDGTASAACNGVLPIKWIVAYDVLAVVVHNDNSWANQLNYTQLYKIFTDDSPARYWNEIPGLENAPHEVLLILDATTGQNGLSQAKLFSEAVGIDNVVLTKLDGTARGGIVIAIRKQLGIPVKWVGLGEKMEDLVLFDSEAFMDGMLG